MIVSDSFTEWACPHCGYTHVGRIFEDAAGNYRRCPKTDGKVPAKTGATETPKTATPEKPPVFWVTQRGQVINLREYGEPYRSSVGVHVDRGPESAMLACSFTESVDWLFDQVRYTLSQEP